MNINQPLQYILKLCLLATIVNSLAVNVVAAEVQTFGQADRNGVDGRSGRDGNSASDQIIRASEQLQPIDIFGTDGEAGESATSGEQAYFLENPEVPADNNQAERSLRLAVTKRKVSGGSRSMDRFKHTAHLLTVVQTCRRQSWSVISFFAQALLANYNNYLSRPSLLPEY